MRQFSSLPGSDIPFLPSARLDEPTMYLTLIDWNTVKTRLHVGHLFTFMESSKHLAHPCMQVTFEIYFISFYS